MSLATKTKMGRKPSTDTPQRPPIASDESISSLESTLSTLSLFDQESTGAQTPITPFEDPIPAFSPRIAEGKADKTRRQLFPEKPVVENIQNADSPGRQILAIPRATERARARSAPEKGQTIDRKATEEIAHLKGQLEELDLEKNAIDGIDSPLAKKSTRRKLGQRKVKTRQLAAEEDGMSPASRTTTTRSMKREGIGITSYFSPKAHDVEVVRSSEKTNLPRGSRTSPKTNHVIAMNTEHDLSVHLDAQTSSITKQQGHAEPVESEPESILAHDINPGSEEHTMSSSPTASNLMLEESRSISPSPTTESAAESLNGSASPVNKVINQSVLSTVDIPQSHQQKRRQRSGSNQDLMATSPVLIPFKSNVIPGLTIKLKILKSLRQQNLDPKSYAYTGSKILSKRDPKLGGESKSPKKKSEYNRLDGYVYIFTSSSFPGYCKIGQTRQRPEERAKEWSGNCKLKAEHIFDPKDKCFPHYGRVEALVHLELCNERRKYECNHCLGYHCFGLKPGTKKLELGPTEHGEWFDISVEEALAVVEKWRKWVVDNKPYREDGSLRKKWIWKHNEAQNCVEMNWGTWLSRKLPKALRQADNVERDWDWDRWRHMRWDDWVLYLSHEGLIALRTIWLQVEAFLWHPGLIVWGLVVLFSLKVYYLCGEGILGLIVAVVLCLAVWVLGTILKS